MRKELEWIKHTRTNLLSLVNNLSIEQLNELSPGFNNNIAWNLGHLVAAQQGVCYVRAGLEPPVGEAFYNLYKPGTKPDHFIDAAELEKIKGLLFSTLEPFEKDYQKGLFVNYRSWTTRYGATLNSIEDAISFLLFHDGFHVGYVMALKRALKEK